MIQEALIVTLTSWLIGVADSFLGWQTLSRPIVTAAITGLVCGDLTTGLIMGAELEAIYMGVSGIGGVVPADAKTSSVIAVAFTIFSGLDIEAGLALAVPIGTITAQFGAPMRVLSDALNPYWLKAAKDGNDKLYSAMTIAWSVFASTLLTNLTIFFSIAFGVEGISSLINNFPPFVLGGLKAAGNMMAVIGLAITGVCIWSTETWVYVFLGFVLARFMGLTSLQIAIVAFVICYAVFFRELQIKKITSEPKTEGGEDFYG